jgi:putative FmdB family regulatory protein
LVAEVTTMPIYEYRCRTCGTVYDSRRSMADADAPATCPAGHVGAVRLLPVFATVGASSDQPAGTSGASMAGGCGVGCACHGG